MNESTSHFGELIAFFTTISWSIGIFPFTQAARRLGPNSVNQFRLILAVVFLTIIAIFFSVNPLQLFTTPVPGQWLWYGLSGIIGLALGDYFGFTSFAILGTRLGSVFNTMAPAAALILGLILLETETINWVGFIGMVITIAGVIWVLTSKEDKSSVLNLSHGSYKKGILFAILSSLCQGAGLVLSRMGQEIEISDKVQAPELHSVHQAWLRMVVATTVIILVTIFRGKSRTMWQPVLTNQNDGVKYAVAGTIFGPVLGVTLSMFAISLTQVSVAQTIFSLLPVVVMFIGFLFLNEKITMRAWGGALLAITGVIILIWRDAIMDSL